MGDEGSEDDFDPKGSAKKTKKTPAKKKSGGKRGRGGHQDQQLPRRRKTRAQSTTSITSLTPHLSPRKAPTIPEIQTTDRTLPTPGSGKERRLRTQAGQLTTTTGDQGKISPVSPRSQKP